MKRFWKSTPPRSSPIGGMRMSLTNEVTILPKAPPMITATARSITFPRATKSLNSLSIEAILSKVSAESQSVAADESCRAFGGAGVVPSPVWITVVRRDAVGQRLVGGGGSHEVLHVGRRRRQDRDRPGGHVLHVGPEAGFQLAAEPFVE